MNIKQMGRKKKNWHTNAHTHTYTDQFDLILCKLGKVNQLRNMVSGASETLKY